MDFRFTDSRDEISQVFLSETTDQILGLLKPNGHMVIRASSEINSIATYFHEKAHSNLIISTSLGGLMEVLSHATSSASLIEDRSNAKTLLRSIVEQCWFVHEGHATVSQLISQFGAINSAGANDYIQSMPFPYQLAIKDFANLDYQVDLNSVQKHFLSRASSCNNERYANYKSSYPRTPESIIGLLSFLIAKAAKDIPIVSFLSGDIFPSSTEILTFVRNQSPDIRKKAICDAINRNDFSITEIAIEYHDANFDSIESDKTDPLDRKCDELSKRLCDFAGLDFESSNPQYKFSIARQVGIDQQNIRIKEVGQLPLDAIDSKESENVAIPSIYPPKNILSELDAVTRLNNLTNRTGGKFDVICEIVTDTQDNYRIRVNLYKSASRALTDYARVNLPEYLAFKKFLSVRYDKEVNYDLVPIFFGYFEWNISETVICRLGMTRLISHVSHYSWRWLLPVDSRRHLERVLDLKQCIYCPHVTSDLVKYSAQEIVKPSRTFTVLSFGIGIDFQKDVIKLFSNMPLTFGMKSWCETDQLGSYQCYTVHVIEAGQYLSLPEGNYEQSIYAHSIFFSTINETRSTL